MRDWSFATNPFTIVTEKSYYNALALSTYHDNALQAAKADAAIAALYTTFHPIHVAYKSNYDAWITQGGTQQGETLNFYQMQHLLSGSKIQQWDIKIQNVYLPTSPQYKKILPNKRSPFQKGTQLERLHAVQALSKSIGADASLAAVKTDIDTFYTQLELAYNTQKGSISTTKSSSSNLETARIALCNAMYGNVGALIQKYATNPIKIEQFFDQKIMRRSQQVFFTGHVKPAEVITVVKHTFTDTDEIYLNNIGTVALQVYLATSKNLHPSATTYKLTPGEHTIPIKSLGSITDTYITIFNPDANIVGSYEVEIV